MAKRSTTKTTVSRKPRTRLLRLNVVGGAPPVHALREGVWAACGALLIRHEDAVTGEWEKVTCALCRSKLPAEP
jgi:hypothetical protein